MNTTPATVRFAAVFASIAITWSLVSGVYALAQPPVADALLAQGVSSIVVR